MLVEDKVLCCVIYRQELNSLPMARESRGQTQRVMMHTRDNMKPMGPEEPPLSNDGIIPTN